MAAGGALGARVQGPGSRQQDKQGCCERGSDEWEFQEPP